MFSVVYESLEVSNDKLFYSRLFQFWYLIIISSFAIKSYLDQAY